jgi:hypothetical protein
VRKAYLIVYSDGTGGRSAIRDWCSSEPLILHWRYDMPHAFYLISEADAATLASSLTEHIGKRGRFLITEISSNRQGWLPKKTWQMLRTKQNE